MRENALFESHDEDEGKFEALGAVKGHQVDDIRLLVERVRVRNEGNLFEKERRRVFERDGVIFFGDGKELLHIFEAGFPFIGAGRRVISGTRRFPRVRGEMRRGRLLGEVFVCIHIWF
jgi:hypothetical protein